MMQSKTLFKGISETQIRTSRFKICFFTIRL